MSVDKGFDKAANDYDEVFSNSKIGIGQRAIVHNLLSKSFKEKVPRILEINCGTGEDVTLLFTFCETLMVTDQSIKMVEKAKEKNSNIEVEFDILDINNIENLAIDDLDGVFSNFGGLNCISPQEMSTFFKRISEKMKVGGKLVLVIMPRKCFWENLFFKLKGEKQKAKRRLSKGAIIAMVNEVEIPTWYYSPKEIQNIAGSQFKCNRLKPVGLFIPPSYLENTFLTNPFIFNILKGLEWVFGIKAFSNYADHYYIELELK